MALGGFPNPPPDPAGRPDRPAWLEQAAKFVAATRFLQLFGADGRRQDDLSTGRKESRGTRGRGAPHSPYVGKAEELPRLGHPDWN